MQMFYVSQEYKNIISPQNYISDFLESWHCKHKAHIYRQTCLYKSRIFLLQSTRYTNLAFWCHSFSWGMRTEEEGFHFLFPPGHKLHISHSSPPGLASWQYSERVELRTLHESPQSGGEGSSHDNKATKVSIKLKYKMHFCWWSAKHVWHITTPDTWPLLSTSWRMGWLCQDWYIYLFL